MTDRCVMCGEIIPEGRQFCPKCENATRSQDEICEEIIRLRKEGKRWREIAEIYHSSIGLIATKVTRYKARNGIAMKDYNPSNDGTLRSIYMNIQAAIIEQAVEDYEEALFYNRQPDITELEEWFDSEWANQLTNGNGWRVKRRVADYMKHLRPKIRNVGTNPLMPICLAMWRL